jgi:hypothetical protein
MHYGAYMIKKLLKTLLFLFFIQTVTQAQWSLGGGYSKISNRLFWSDGATVQLEYNTSIEFAHTSIAFGGGYSIFSHSGNLPDLATPTVMGFHREFSVKPYQIVDILANAEHRFSDDDFHLYASIGLGVGYYSPARAKMRQWIDSGGQLVPSFTDYEPSEHVFQPSYQLALGYSFPLTSYYSIGPELCYDHSLRTGLIRFSANVRIRSEL